MFLEVPGDGSQSAPLAVAPDAAQERGRRRSISVCPASRMGTHGRWLRLIVSLAVSALENAPCPPARAADPVLFILEEFAALGHMRALEQAVAYMAGFGVKLWAVLQDLTQLKRHYKEGWETFLGNAGRDPGLQRRGSDDLRAISPSASARRRFKSRTRSMSAPTRRPRATPDCGASSKPRRCSRPTKWRENSRGVGRQRRDEGRARARAAGGRVSLRRAIASFTGSWCNDVETRKRPQTVCRSGAGATAMRATCISIRRGKQSGAAIPSDGVS